MTYRFLASLVLLAAVNPLFAQRSLTRFVYAGTYAGKPAAGLANQIAIITDCVDTTCSTGGGSTVRLMRDTGSAWAVLGDGDSGGSPAFSSITAGTSTAALVVGTGGSLGVSGSGTINATSLGGTAAASYALLNSPSFTTPILGAASATSIAFGGDPADAGAIRCSNNAVCLAAEIAIPGTDMTLTPNSSDQWAFSHAVVAPGFISSDGSNAGYYQFGQGTATSPDANTIRMMGPTSVPTAYTVVLPGSSSTGFWLGTDSSNVNTVTFVGSTGSGNVARATSAGLTTPVITTNIQPASAGGAAIGTNALPFSSIFLGADGNTLQITGTATSDKVVTVPDVTGTVVVAATSTTATQAMFATSTAGAPAFRAIADADVPDTITASNYLPLAGGTMTGSIITDNLGIEFAESDTNPTCGANDYHIYADLSENKLKKCMNGSATDLDTTGGTPSFDTITGGTNTTAAMVVGSGGSLGVSGTGTIVATSGDSATSFFSTGTIETTYLPAASDTASGIAELAIASEVTTGTDTARAITPNALADSTIFGVKTVEVEIFPAGTAATTGDGKAYFRIPASMNGMNLISVKANVYTAGTTNTINLDIARCAAAATGNVCSGTVSDVLSTNLTIDSAENSSSTAATAAVIDTGQDDVATDQLYRFDIDAIHTTPSQGMIVELTFQLP